MIVFHTASDDEKEEQQIIRFTKTISGISAPPSSKKSSSRPSSKPSSAKSSKTKTTTTTATTTSTKAPNVDYSKRKSAATVSSQRSNTATPSSFHKPKTSGGGITQKVLSGTSAFGPAPGGGNNTKTRRGSTSFTSKFIRRFRSIHHGTNQGPTDVI